MPWRPPDGLFELLQAAMDRVGAVDAAARNGELQAAFDHLQDVCAAVGGACKIVAEAVIAARAKP